MTTADFTPGNYRFLPFAFQYSSGVAAMPGYEIERVQFRKPVPLHAGLRARRAVDSRARPAADVVLRLRAALARPVHRHRLLRIQQEVRRHAGEVGRVRRQDQSGGALQRLSGDRRAGRAVLPRLLVHRARRKGSAELRDRRQRGGAARRGQLPRAHRALGRERRRRAAREGGVRARRDGGKARRVSASPGPTPRRRRSILCSICIRSWPTRSCGAAPRAPGCRGTSPARRCRCWITRWIAARWRGSS